MSSYSCELRDTLVGALIGLARSTYGNEHLVSDATADAVVEGLLASGTNLTSETLPVLLNRVDQEKRKLVPGCYNCMAPCGRNNEYDMRSLLNAEAEVRNIKMQLLSCIQEIAAHAHQAAGLGYRDEAIYSFLYKALFAIGMDDWGMEELAPILREADEVNAASVSILSRAGE